MWFFLFLLSATTYAGKPLTHAQAGQLIMTTLAQGPTAPSLDWERSLATGARVHGLLLEKLGLKP